MKTASAKAKGRKLQQYVSKKITEIFSLEEGDVESRPMGSGGVDIMASPKARSAFPFSIECKNTKTFPSLGALRQAACNEYQGTLGGVVWKPPGKSPGESIIYFNFAEFAEFWQKLHKEENDAKRS